MRYVCHSHVACLVFVFFCRALGGASIETWILRHATFSFLRQRDGPFGSGRGGEGGFEQVDG